MICLRLLVVMIRKVDGMLFTLEMKLAQIWITMSTLAYCLKPMVFMICFLRRHIIIGISHHTSITIQKVQNPGNQLPFKQIKQEKEKRKVLSKSKAIWDMSNMIEAVTITSTHILAFANELINECMKVKLYGYSGMRLIKHMIG